ncbi:MAG: 2-dehydro-3-deoxy-6-phosphogalactonate aldolase [Hyphomicrobiaceae bacterium]|nr:2-dehydro-3-deoxy-6-phosphogalactonate aldolase [Hyphomicrobiaceae bacterium]
MFGERLVQSPIIAILRGVTPAEVVDVGMALVDAGVHIIEVPLNSPHPMHCIELLAKRLGRDAMIGAGTVMTEAQTREVAQAGGQLIVMPHSDFEVIFAARKSGLVVVPGVATPTEAIATLEAGADGLKLFPAEMITPQVVKSLRAVLPKDALLVPVGGIGVGNIPAYAQAGANGFGIGSTLYAPGRAAREVGGLAKELVAVARAVVVSG